MCAQTKVASSCVLHCVPNFEINTTKGSGSGCLVVNAQTIRVQIPPIPGIYYLLQLCLKNKQKGHS